MNAKKLTFGVLAAILVMTIAVGCAKSKISAIQFVPSAASFVAQVQLDKLLNDRDLTGAYNKAQKGTGQPQTAQEGLEKLTEKTGIDLRDFSQAVVFGDLLQLQNSKSGYLGAIAEGNFKEEEFVQGVKNKTGHELSTSDYKGYKLYADKDAQTTLAFLDDGLLVIGTPNAVKDTIDVRKGDKKPLGGSIMEAYNRLGDGLVKSAFILPKEATKSLQQEAPGGFPVSLKALASIDTIGFILSKEAGEVTIRIDSHFTDSASAQDGKDTISGLISLLKGTMQKQQAKELMGKIQVTAADSWLSISLTSAVSDLETLGETMQGR